MRESYDYRNTIQTEFERRAQRNPRYTLRSFARDLNISVSSLSLILAGKQGLSIGTATTICEKLKLEDREIEIFVASVKSLHSRIAKERTRNKKVLNNLLKVYRKSILHSKIFQDVSKWQFFALLEYLRSHPKTKPEIMANALRMPLPVLQDYLLKLQNAGILVKEPTQWKLKAEIFSIISDAPSRVIRDFHQGVITRASEAIEKQSMKERTLAATFFAFDPEKFPEIEEKIREFRLNLIREYSIKSENAEVFCLSQQLFQLSNFAQSEIL
ncbi:MAG: TIGR02147 family protein [Bdellovibrio sp.]